MRNFILSIMMLFACISLTSCTVSTYAQTADDYDVVTTVDVNYHTIVTYGTPYYVNGIISYYFYNNIYYYPYIWQNRHYFMPYRTVRPHGFVYVPSRYHRPDYRYCRDYHYRPNVHVTKQPTYRPNNSGYNRPNTRPQYHLDRKPTQPQHNRPMTTPRNNNNGHFSGGSRGSGRR